MNDISIISSLQRANILFVDIFFTAVELSDKANVQIIELELPFGVTLRYITFFSLRLSNET